MRTIAIAAVSVWLLLSGTGAIAASSDELDKRIEALEQQNAALKKQVRLHQLELENQRLKKQLGNPKVQEGDASTPTNIRAHAGASAEIIPSSARPAAGYDLPLAHKDNGEATRWSGPYAGLIVGGARGTWKTSPPPIGQGGRVNANGATAGIIGGYLWQQGRLVFGPEVDFSVSSVGRNATANNIQFNADTRWIADFGGRIGYAFDNWLLFATGAYAVTGLEISSTTPGDSGDRPYSDGFAAGGGLQYAIGKSVSLRADYMYYGFRKRMLPLSQVQVSPAMSAVRAGLIWHFD